jgi:hypothetical protein
MYDETFGDKVEILKKRTVDVISSYICASESRWRNDLISLDKQPQRKPQWPQSQNSTKYFLGGFRIRHKPSPPPHRMWRKTSAQALRRLPFRQRVLTRRTGHTLNFGLFLLAKAGRPENLSSLDVSVPTSRTCTDLEPQ